MLDVGLLLLALLVVPLIWLVAVLILRERPERGCGTILDENGRPIRPRSLDLPGFMAMGDGGGGCYYVDRQGRRYPPSALRLPRPRQPRALRTLRTLASVAPRAHDVLRDRPPSRRTSSGT
jgi:hypothetical protein